MSLNFVAAEDGLENDPKVLTLARLLKKPRAFAFWYVMMWRRLIVNVGNALTGALPKSYTADDLAAFLDWEGKPPALVAAMKATGFLASKKGRGLFYPAWAQTITGHYASRREVERRRDEARRAERRESEARGQPAEAPRVLHGGLRGSSVEAPRGILRSIKEGNPRRAPPGPPWRGGSWDGNGGDGWSKTLQHREMTGFAGRSWLRCRPTNGTSFRSLSGGTRRSRRAWGPLYVEKIDASRLRPTFS